MGFFQEEGRRKKIAALAALLAGLGGCVKTVYLPKDAAYYKDKLEECRANLAECEDDLLLCIELGEDVRNLD